MEAVPGKRTQGATDGSSKPEFMISWAGWNGVVVGVGVSETVDETRALDEESMVEDDAMGVELDSGADDGETALIEETIIEVGLVEVAANEEITVGAEEGIVEPEVLLEMSIEESKSEEVEIGVEETDTDGEDNNGTDVDEEEAMAVDEEETTEVDEEVDTIRDDEDIGTVDGELGLGDDSSLQSP
jgi:hypothetical protein